MPFLTKTDTLSETQDKKYVRFSFKELKKGLDMFVRLCRLCNVWQKKKKPLQAKMNVRLASDRAKPSETPARNVSIVVVVVVCCCVAGGRFLK